MGKFCFRVVMDVAPRLGLNIDEHEIRFPCPDGHGILCFRAAGPDTPIRDATSFVLTGRNWEDETDAHAAAVRYLGALQRTLAKLRVGVDTGARMADRGGMNISMREHIRETTGQRILNEAVGILVYECDPEPRFQRVHAEVRGLQPESHFPNVFNAALQEVEQLSSREQVALDLYNYSTFQTLVESRFLLLVMAVEALVQPAPRSASARTHLKSLVQLTNSASELTQSERDSIAGALRGLERESIRRAARRTIEERLGEREYGGLRADRFFDGCYALRSSLAHGSDPLPAKPQLVSAAISLEFLVSDLLSGLLVEVDADTGLPSNKRIEPTAKAPYDAKGES